MSRSASVFTEIRHTWRSGSVKQIIGDTIYPSFYSQLHVTKEKCSLTIYFYGGELMVIHISDGCDRLWQQV